MFRFPGLTSAMNLPAVQHALAYLATIDDALQYQRSPFGDRLMLRPGTGPTGHGELPDPPSSSRAGTYVSTSAVAMEAEHLAAETKWHAENVWVRFVTTSATSDSGAVAVASQGVKVARDSSQVVASVAGDLAAEAYVKATK